MNDSVIQKNYIFHLVLLLLRIDNIENCEALVLKRRLDSLIEVLLIIQEINAELNTSTLVSRVI